jgi:hypothetical protein
MTNDYAEEIRDAYRKYRADRRPAELSTEALGYIRHCLRKAAQTAALLGEDPEMGHHPFFALIATEDGGDLFPEFLMSVPRDRALAKDD